MAFRDVFAISSMEVLWNPNLPKSLSATLTIFSLVSSIPMITFYTNFVFQYKIIQFLLNRQRSLPGDILKGFHHVEVEPGGLPANPEIKPHVEPGLYFQEDDLLVPEELRGIGIRIEDDILVTADGQRNLSASLPRTSTDVEEWMGALRG